jgi:hypothetical protein
MFLNVSCIMFMCHKPLTNCCTLVPHECGTRCGPREGHALHSKKKTVPQQGSSDDPVVVYYMCLCAHRLLLFVSKIDLFVSCWCADCRLPVRHGLASSVASRQLCLVQ